MSPRMSLAVLLFTLCVTALVMASACAAQILVVDLAQADYATRMLVASVQGVVNRDPSQVGIYVLREPQDAVWLSLYEGETVRVTVEEMVARVRDRLAGQVLYDPAEQHSINLAATAAAVLDAALTTRDLGLKTVLDARGRWADRLTAYRYAVAQVLAQAAPDRLALVGAQRTDLRDYLARERVLAVDLDWKDPQQAALLQELLVRLESGSLILGTPEMANDNALLGMLAGREHVLVPVGPTANLSFHAAHPLTESLHQIERLAPLAYQIMVTFVYEGGADVGYALGRMRALWEDPARGSVPLGWTISPALLEVAPAVMQSYFADAWRSGNDELVLAPNGPGYFVPTRQGSWGRLLERMAASVHAADLRVAAISDSGAGAEVVRALSYYRRAGVRGVLLAPGGNLTSGVYGGVPVVVRSVRATDAYETLRAIRRAAENDKYIYVSVDPWSLTPTELAHIAARLGERYLVLRPREFVEVARQTTATKGQAPSTGEAQIAEVMLRPADAGPRDAVAVRATVHSAKKLDLVWAAYTIGKAPEEWAVQLEPEPDHRYSGTLPPVLEGGEVSVRLRAVDVGNGFTWSAPVTFSVEAPDADKDGLSDAVERFLRTAPDKPDTDGDGWRDGNDVRPLLPNHAVPIYLWPVVPPGDAPYIVEGGGTVSEDTRAIEADQEVVYRLPLASVPVGARPVLQAVVGGDYRLQASTDGKQWQEIGAGVEAPLAADSWEIPAEYLARRSLWVRMSDHTPEGGSPARISELSILAQPDGPSILPRGSEPSDPAAGMPITVLADVFSPHGVSEVRLHYQLGESGTIIIPMSERRHSQVYAANVYGARNGDKVVYWVTAADSKGNISAIRPRCFHVGTSSQDTISLLAARDFEGEWQLAAEWAGSRWSPRAEAMDKATINVAGGIYRVWVLAAPRDGGLRVRVDGRDVGTIPAAAPDGWHSLRSIDLPRGRRGVTLTAIGAGRCGYAQVLVTSDRNLVPPQGMVYDLYNSLIALAPAPGQAVKGLVNIVATATGNIGVVECYVDGKLVGRERTPPYRFRWNARRAAAGPHAVELRALDHAGELLLTTGMEVEIGK